MSEAILRIEGLKKSYGSLQAVKDLNLEVFAGEILGFLGPNGAGKTTSISMMCGLLRPDAGQITFHGIPLTSRNRALRSRIGLCPQEIALWERLTCAEQLRFAAQMHGLSRADALTASERLLEEFGLIEQRRKQARRLSGGMQRRLNVALALVHDPDIVFLDEPEVGLDPQSRVLLREHIRRYAGLKTIILTTHNMDEAERLSDRVAIMDHGALLALDTPNALKRSVGYEDTLEIDLDAPLQDARGLEVALSGMNIKLELDPANSVIYLRGKRIIESLPGVSEALKKSGASVGEMRLRQTSLEDVFIHHTGRRLRQ